MCTPTGAELRFDPKDYTGASANRLTVAYMAGFMAGRVRAVSEGFGWGFRGIHEGRWVEGLVDGRAVSRLVAEGHSEPCAINTVQRSRKNCSCGKRRRR